MERNLGRSVMQRNWIAAAFLALAAAGQAVAQDDEEQQGFYVGAGLGDFSTQIDELDGDNISFDESDTAYKLFFGYRFNQFFGAQLDYLDLGRSDSAVGLQNLEIETGGYAARIEGTLPLAFFELFATAGLIFSDVEASVGGTEFFDESDNDPVYSVGLGFEIAERVVLRLEYEIIDIETYDDAEAVWFTAAWRL
jgi:OmpA-OmpF porin, OOP family